MITISIQLGEVSHAESEAIAKLYARLHYLNGCEALFPPSASNAEEFELATTTPPMRNLSEKEKHSIRMSRFLVDHMARNGYHHTAKQIMDKVNNKSNNNEKLTDSWMHEI